MGLSLSSVTDDGRFSFFQARNIKTGELAAVKIIKLEPGKCFHPPCRWLNGENDFGIPNVHWCLGLTGQQQTMIND